MLSQLRDSHYCKNSISYLRCWNLAVKPWGNSIQFRWVTFLAICMLRSPNTSILSSILWTWLTTFASCRLLWSIQVERTSEQYSYQWTNQFFFLEAATIVMIRANRTNQATVTERKSLWEIRVNFYSGKGVARKLLSSSGYDCKSSALWHAPYFRHAAEMSSRG